MQLDNGPRDVIRLGHAAMSELLQHAHLLDPADFGAVVAEHARTFDATEVVVYCIDYSHGVLVPLPSVHGPDRVELAVDGTVAGRAFVTSSPVEVAVGPPSGRRLWLPVLVGTDRLGVIEFTFGTDSLRRLSADTDTDHIPGELMTVCRRYATLVAELMISKAAYGDVFEWARRRKRLSLAAEVQWRLLPPLTVATEHVVIAGQLEPAHEVAGDSFDYALNGDTVHIAVFDAMGHGLSSAMLASVAVAAYRNSRRHLDSLEETYRAIDSALMEIGLGERFVTGTLTELDIRRGTLRWVCAGHLPGLLLRGGHSIRELASVPATPFGLGLTPGNPDVGREVLEPEDRVLLYSDGVIEARTAEGEFFGVDRLTDFVIKESAAGQSPPETLRRLCRAVLDHQHGVLQDDAMTVLLEWRREGHRTLLPAYE
jgi:Stage II sporulation protein E (SpoIIE)